MLSKFIIGPVLQKQSILIPIIIIGLLSSYILFANLGENTPVYPDEALYSVIDIRTVQNNTGVLLPEENSDLPYFFKPPLKTWLQYPFLKIFGVSGFTLRALSAVMGIASILILMAIAYKLKGSFAALISGFSMITFYGMLRDYWARVNGYDAGLVLFSLIFLYLFLFMYESKYCYLYCGLALAGAFYFKHIAALIPLFVITAYLLLTKGYKSLIEKKYLLMISVFLVSVLAWHLPYFISEPQNFKYFISIELKQRIIEGFPGQQGYGIPQAPLDCLEQVTGKWFPWLVPSLLIFGFLGYRNKKQEYILPILWFIIPSILFTISASHLCRYMFSFYPALALIIGIAFSGTIMKLLEQKQNKIIRLSTLLLSSMIILLLIMTAIASLRTTLKVINPHNKSNFHIIVDRFIQNTGGTLFITETDRTKFGWPEQVLLEFVPEQVVTVNIKDVPDLVDSLNPDDALIVYRWELVELLTVDIKTPIKPEKHSFLIIPRSTDRYNSTRKVALFNRDSNIAKFLNRHRIPFENISDLISQPPSDDIAFVTFLYKTAFGIQNVSTQQLSYYKSILSEGKISRETIAERFSCYAKYYNPRNYPSFINRKTGEIKKDNFHKITDYYVSKPEGSIFIRELEDKNFTPNFLCYFNSSSDSWKHIDSIKSLPDTLSRLSPEDILILPRSSLFRYLAVNNIPKELEGKYLFFDFKKYRGYFSEREQYFNICGITLRDSAIANYLQNESVTTAELTNLPDKLDWSLDDDEFIQKVCRLILGAEIHPESLDHYFPELSTVTSRKAYVFARLKSLTNRLTY